MTGKNSALSHSQDNILDASSVMPAPSDVYAGLRLQKLPEQLCQQPSQSLALYGVEQRKWPWLLHGWPAALQPSMSTSTSCTYMAWPKNEITKVFSSKLSRLLFSKEITVCKQAGLALDHTINKKGAMKTEFNPLNLVRINKNCKIKYYLLYLPLVSLLFKKSYLLLSPPQLLVIKLNIEYSFRM